MTIFATTGSILYIGPAQSGDLNLGQYEAIDTASKATGSYAFSANPVTTSTIVIAGTSVEFITTFVSGNEVQIGNDLEATLADLLEFLTESSDSNLVKCTYALASDTGPLLITSVIGGSPGNAYGTTTTGTSYATPAGTTLLNGGGSGWTVIGETESLGDFGDTAASITFTSIVDSRVRKMKGARDAGNMALVCGMDMRDAGQIALIAGQKTAFYYAFKMVASDKRLVDDTPTIFYWNALVESAKTNFGATNNVPKTTFTLGINTEILDVASAPA